MWANCFNKWARLYFDWISLTSSVRAYGRCPDRDCHLHVNWEYTATTAKSRRGARDLATRFLTAAIARYGGLSANVRAHAAPQEEDGDPGGLMRLRDSDQDPLPIARDLRN